MTSTVTPVRIGPRMIPLDDLVPHPLNANSMAPDLREKLKVHIRRSGRYPHVIVRPVPAQPGKFQILDGHHRVEVLRELGHHEGRCDIWMVDDREALILLGTLNRLEGADIPARRAQLMHELLGEMNVEDLGGLLPESAAQVEELIALLQFPAEAVAAELEAEAEKAEKNLPVVLSFVVSPQQAETIEQAVEMASDGTVGRDRRARGLCNLARHFLKERSDEAATQESA